jgi:hypothetical protein
MLEDLGAVLEPRLGHQPWHHVQGQQLLQAAVGAAPGPGE